MSERLDRERDEIRSSIGWALQTDDAETVGRLLAPLFTYWWSRGLLPMTSELAEQAAAMPSAASLPPYASALLLGARGISMVMIGRAAEAEPLLRDAGDGDLPGQSPAAGLRTARTGGALVAPALGEAASGWTPPPGLSARSTTGGAWPLTLSTRGQLALVAGDVAAARTMHEEALGAAR